MYVFYKLLFFGYFFSHFYLNMYLDTYISNRNTCKRVYLLGRFKRVLCEISKPALLNETH